MNIYIICNNKIKNKHGNSGSDINFLSKVFIEFHNIFNIVDSIYNADLCICLSSHISNDMNEILNINEKYNIPIFAFVWDYYFNNCQQSIFNKLKNKKNINILVPNFGSGLCLMYNNFNNNIYTTPCFAQYFSDDIDIDDKNYIALFTRPYDFDPCSHWAEWACQELSIPYVSRFYNNGKSKNFDLDDYKYIISNCSFLICSHLEASTGGLSLLEGFRLGKPLLISNSILNGANDIFQDLVNKFDYNSYDDLKNKIQDMWLDRPKYDILKCRKFCDDNFSVSSFINNINMIFSNHIKNDSSLQSA